MRSRLVVSAFFLSSMLLSVSAHSQLVASDLTDSGSIGLLSYENLWTDAFSSPGDGFQVYQRGVSASIPFSVLDDSAAIFPADSLGIIDESNRSPFFGATDTVNGDTSGPVTATWVFNIAGASDLALSIDVGAMGDFEASDSFVWRYSIDGGPEMVAFQGVADESASNTYTLAGGRDFTLNDPFTLNGEVLTNVLRTFSTLISGTGSELTLTLTVSTDGGSEAFAFQNIVINQGGLPLDIVAFDMLNSGSQNLVATGNPFENEFGSPGDGFQKYQRNVSPSIPFSVLDDSLVTFPSDTLGIIDDDNVDVFFGVTDTVNADNSDPVSATWTFDISGGENLGVLVDIGAMGDFESSDFFEWSYQVDGGPGTVLISSSVDENGSNTYLLAGGAMVTLDDPMLVNGTVLSNVLQTFSAPIAGTGSELVLVLTASTDGGSEAFAFQNLIVAEGFDAPEPTPVVEIFEIQGDGGSSPYDGMLVESTNNVVTALAPNGFFMQTPEFRTDNNVDTSDGIFVFLGAPPSVAVGDHVDVVGSIDEFFGMTEFDDDSTVTVVSGGNPLPAAIVFDATRPSPDPANPSCAIEYECYEGMLVSIANGIVTGPNQEFGSDPVAEVFITAGASRTYREPGVAWPGLGIAGIATWDGNPEVLELDPDKLGLDNELLSSGARFSATGVIGFEFGDYELWPAVLEILEAPVLPVVVRSRDDAEFTVGSLNLFRLFDDVDDPESFDFLGRERNDTVVPTAEYDVRRAKLAAYIVDVLDAPDVLGVQEVESLAVLEALAAEIASTAPGIIYSAYLEEGNDIGTIDVGFLVRDTVDVDDVAQIDPESIQTGFGDPAPLHDRPPLLLSGRVTAGGSNFPVAVIVVHNRSLGGIDSGSDGERVRDKRLKQAQSVAAAIQSLQTENPAVQLVVTGDFNAFEFSDGYVDAVGEIAGNATASENLLPGTDLVDPDLVIQTGSIAPAERYSFIFDGSAQALDHALTSSSLDLSVRGLAYGRGNADAPEIIIEDPLTSLRSSDHDGLVLYITRDRDSDGVFDSLDACPGTVIPEAPTRELGTNRWALADDDRHFDTVAPKGNGSGRSFSTADTAGCSCTQIVRALGLGLGQAKFGCSAGIMDRWVRQSGQ